MAVGYPCTNDGYMQPSKLDAFLAARWPPTLVASTSELAAKGIGDRALTAGVASGKAPEVEAGCLCPDR